MMILGALVNVINVERRQARDEEISDQDDFKIVKSWIS